MDSMTTSGIFKGAAIGGAVAAAANVALYFAGGAAGAEYMMLPPGGGPLQPIPIVMPAVMSLVPALIGAGVLIGLRRLFPEKAWTIFLAITGVVFVLMLPGPMMQMGEDAVAVIVLELMHVVLVAGVILGIRRFGSA